MENKKNDISRTNPRGSDDLEQLGGLALPSINQGVSPTFNGASGVEIQSIDDLNAIIDDSNIRNKFDVVTAVTNKLFNDHVKESGYKIDFLTFTMDISTDDEIETEFYKGTGNDINIAINFLNEAFGISVDDMETGHNANNFNTGLTIGGFFKIFYNDLYKEIKSKSTTKVAQITFTGQGCTWLYDLMPDNYKILNTVFENAKNITRIDIAFDSFYKEDIINLDDMIAKLDDYSYTSQKRSHKIFKESDSEANIYSKGFYLGSSSTKNSYYLRCYDKLSQYKSKNQLIPDVAKESGRWERFEISFNGKVSAGLVVEDFLFNPDYQNNMDKLFKSVMAQAVTFRDKAYTKTGKLRSEKHKERWKVSQFWTDYLNNTPAYKFSSISRDPNFVSTLGFISNSVMPTLRLLDEILSAHNIDIYSELKQYRGHKSEMSKKHERTVLDSAKLTTDEVKEIMNVFKIGGLKKESSKKTIKRNGEEIG